MSRAYGDNPRMPFGYGLIAIGAVSVLIAFLSQRRSRVVNGAGRRSIQVIWGLLVIGAGLGIVLADGH